MPDFMWLDFKRYKNIINNIIITSVILAILILITKINNLNDENYKL